MGQIMQENNIENQFDDAYQLFVDVLKIAETTRANHTQAIQLEHPTKTISKLAQKPGCILIRTLASTTKYQNFLTSIKVLFAEKNRQQFLLFLMKNAFIKNEVKIEGKNAWSFNQNIFKLFCLIDFMQNMTLPSHKLFLYDIKDFHNTNYKFYTLDKNWVGSWYIMYHNDEVLPSEILSTNVDFYRLRLHPHIDNSYILQEFKNKIVNIKPNQVVISIISDSRYSEPVFFIKRNNQLQIILSQSKHRHQLTIDIITDNKAQYQHSDSIKLIHNGDCTVYSEEAILTVAETAKQNNMTVYEVLSKLFDNEIELLFDNEYLNKFCAEYNIYCPISYPLLRRLIAVFCFNIFGRNNDQKILPENISLEYLKKFFHTPTPLTADKYAKLSEIKNQPMPQQQFNLSTNESIQNTHSENNLQEFKKINNSNQQYKLDNSTLLIQKDIVNLICSFGNDAKNVKIDFARNIEQHLNNHGYISDNDFFKYLAKLFENTGHRWTHSTTASKFAKAISTSSKVFDKNSIASIRNYLGLNLTQSLIRQRDLRSCLAQQNAVVHKGWRAANNEEKKTYFSFFTQKENNTQNPQQQQSHDYNFIM